MLRRRLSICFAATIACAAQTVSAQVGGLPEEISVRQAADAQLENKINAESAARSAADTQLQSNINAEAAARSAVDTQLQNNINAEAAGRSAADTQLQSNINAEAAARAAADAQLQTQIQELRGGNGGGGTVNVDCASGGSISQALAAGAGRVVVRGTCSESVTISRDDVTLQGDGTVGGRIHGPDPDANTVVITGNRVIIEALTVSGGRNGITGVGASNLTVRNCTVQSTGRSGIAYANGASGTIDGCTVHSNPRDGIVVDGAYATLINSTVTNNTRNGVLVVSAGSARIGVTDRSAPAGNTIQQNGAGGIVVTLGSVVTAAMNQITRNGSFGISVFQSTADIAGGNTISDNTDVGVSVNGSKVLLGDTGLGLSTVNRISGNGGPGGVVAFLGSSMVIRDAEILGNNGAGLLFSLRSQGQLFSSTIQNNTSDGIRLLLGSALLPLPAMSTVSGNGGFGIQCFDAESSVVNTQPPIIALSGNLQGNLSPSCTAFDATPLPPLP